MGPFVLRQIRATSPTLAESMRLCQLRAGLSRAAIDGDYVLGNPKSWLGTAYHEVLEKITNDGATDERLESAVERLWNQAVEAQHERARAHALDCRFGLPMTWPGYYLARASVLLRAEDLVSETGRSTAGRPDIAHAVPGARLAAGIREEKFTAFGGKLVGRPDVVRNTEIIDYKSGVIVEYDEDVKAEVVRASYVRQLRIYGYLVKETLGWWPERGILLPLAGAGIEVTLTPADCERDATDAVALLDAYNTKLLRGGPAEGLASPSPSACRWCPFKLLCPAFWEAATPAWTGHLDGAAIEGCAHEVPQDIYGGAAVSVTLEVDKGTETGRHTQIAPLSRSTHPAVSVISRGDRVRMVSLRARQDAVLVPTARTVVARLADLPAIQLPFQTNQIPNA